MSVRIVTHCYGLELPQYSYFLDAQLWSLREFAPIGTCITICLWLEDFLTQSIIKRHEGIDSEKLEIRLLMTSHKGDLFNRAILRNVAAKRSTEDVVWFTDVDHIFGEGCLQALEEQMKNTEGVLHYPESLLIHKDHETGDKYWKRLKDDSYFYLNQNDFQPMQYHKAIGGVQIVPGWFARKYGYLDHSDKLLKPTDGTKPFPTFRDDVKYRKFCSYHGPTVKLQLPNLYRLRHTEVTYK